MKKGIYWRKWLDGSRSHSLKSVKDTMVFDKLNDYGQLGLFQTGKGHNDGLLQRFILGRHLRKENLDNILYL